MVYEAIDVHARRSRDYEGGQHFPVDGEVEEEGQ